MISVLFKDQVLPDWMFDVVEAPNTLTPTIASFCIVFRRKDVFTVIVFGKAFLKVKHEPNKDRVRMRSKVHLQFKYACL